jgi:hypothetical protein
MGLHVAHSLEYFAASLAGIARALDDFGYRDEARQLFQIQKTLEEKAAVESRDADTSQGRQNE